MKTRKLVLTSVVIGTALLCALPFLADLRRNAQAADHAEAPSCAHDAGADIADGYLFLDPANTNNVIMIMTIHGFVAPQENGNLGFFDPEVLYRFELERTGDAKPDAFIDVQFGPRTSPSVGQTATIKLPNHQQFTALATAPSLAPTPPTPVVTTSSQGVSFFAGLTDDPFFFDIPGFNRFVASVRAGSPDFTTLQRGRDSFAGYNIPSIALSVPAQLIAPTAQGVNLGLSTRTLRRTESFSPKGGVKSVGTYRSVDRMATPTVNTVLIPFARKDQYNAAPTTDDAKGKFAADILTTLAALGTDATYQGILAGVAVAKGDFLRLNLSIPNSGTGRGLPVGSQPEAFPNGRRPSDDVIDIILTLVANGTSLGDNVDNNDQTFGTTFPFLAPSQQPRATGVVDDNTRN